MKQYLFRNLKFDSKEIFTFIQIKTCA